MDEILVERDGGVVWATLNRPEKKNALTLAMAADLVEVLAEVESRPEDRVVLLTGAGGAFSSGADLTDPEAVVAIAAGPAAALASVRRIHALPLALHRLSKPVVAAVAGVAAGAGCNLALACDLVVAASDARFCEIFVRRGLTLDFGGSWLLPRLVGLHRAKELAFLGEMVDAVRAEAIGLVNRVVATEDLERESRELAGRLAAGPPVALAAMKQALHQGLSLSLAESIEGEVLAQTVCVSTADTAEAMRAFIERREPRFHGR
jgi:2-(1,2-epoxy-1,2-dihydrophenyl)acetyl-CoA isomerase